MPMAVPRFGAAGSAAASRQARPHQPLQNARPRQVNAWVSIAPAYRDGYAPAAGWR